MSCRMPREGAPRRLTVFLLALLPLTLLHLFQAPSAVAFTVSSLGDFDNVTVMEVSGNYDAIDSYGQPDMSARREIAKAFYRNHGDDYDFLVIFTNFDFRMPSLQARAFFSPAKNDVRGIGQELNDLTNTYSPDGSFLARLQGTIDMANLSGHALEPAEPKFDETLMTLTHEFLHRWGAYVHFRDGTGESDALLGLDGAHWSFLFDSGGSTLYGNNWRDNADGTFTSIAPEQAGSGEVLGRIFSPLDLYLMGLIDKSQVPPMLLVDAPGLDPTQLPGIGVTVPGMARIVTIDDIISVEGERIPGAADSRKEFRVAFIYAVAPGTWAASEPEDRGEVAAINRLQGEWEKRFSILTDGAARMRTAFVVPEAVESNPEVAAPTFNPAQTQSVNRGVVWLVGRQGQDGSWQDLYGNSRRDTATAVMALKTFPEGAASAAAGQLWLAAVTPENNDFLARKLLSLNSANIAELVALQNSDGGWGSSPGYGSNPADTALVLQALTVHDYIDNGVALAAVNYLHSAQMPDGGWNSGSGGSQAQPTAQALLALNRLRGSCPVETVIADGLAWLIARQNGDGGFGNSPSTVIDTAVALQALKATGAPPAAANSAVNHLLNRQADSGSWNGSVFQTAQAIEALYAGQLAADLVVEAADISFTPVQVAVVPATVAVTVTVRNLGRNAVSQVKVTLYEGDPALGNLIGEQSVDVAGNSSALASFNANVNDTGLHDYYVMVDAENRIAEANEWNNVAVKTLVVNMPPPTVGFGLAVSAGSEAQVSVPIVVSLSYPWPEPITVSYTVNEVSTAVSAADYVIAAGPLTFPAGQTGRTIDLAIVNDLVAEIDKSIIIDLAIPNLGTLGASRHTYTIRDDEVPTVSITSPPNGLIGQSSPPLLYTTTGGNVVVKVDGSAVSKSAGNPLDPLADGSHSVEVMASNSYGLSATSRVDFTVDTALPTVIINAPRGVQTTNAPLLDFLIDGAETVEVRVDGVAVNGISGQPLAPLAEGLHTLTVTATNALGLSNLATSTFTIDTISPLVIIRYPYSGGVLEEAAPQLLYALGESGTVTVRVDGIVVPKVSGDRLGPLNDGEHAVSVILTDGNGVSAEATVVFVVELDAETPLAADPEWSPPSEDLWRRTDVASDGDGNVYMAGMTTGSYDLFVAKYDRRGALLWSKIPWIASMDTDANALGVDAAGNVYAAFTAFDGIGAYGARGGRDVYLAKFSRDGTVLGLTQIACAYDDYVYDMFVAGSGDVYLAGVTGGSLFSGSSGGYSTWVARYDSELRRQWGNQRYHASYYDPENCFITVAPDGMVYVAGRIQGRFDGSGTPLGLDDYYLARWTSAGAYSGFVQSGTSQNDEIYGLGTDAFGSVYLLGATQGALSGYTNSGSADYFLVKYVAGNQLQWVHQWGTTASDEPSALEVEPDGDLYVLEHWNLTKFDRDKQRLWSDQKLTFNNFDEGGADMDGQGNLYAVYTASLGVSLFKYSDQRLPHVAIAVADLTNRASIEVRGTRRADAEVFLSADTGAGCDGILYPSTTTWTCTLSGLVEGDNHLEVVARSVEGFRNSTHATVSRDSTPPLVSIDSPAEGEVYDEKPAIIYRLSDEHPGETTAYLNGRRLVSTRYPLEGLLAGENVLTISATDRAGNPGSATVTFSATGAAVGEQPWGETVLEQFGSTGADVVDQVVKDKVGNIYLTGTVYGDLDGQANHGLGDVFVRKYDPAGRYLWTRLVGTGDTESGKGIAVDDAGNIYLCYQVDYVSVKGKGTNWSDVIIARFDEAFNQVWSRQIGSTEKDYATGIYLDHADRVYVAGNTEGSIDRLNFAGPMDYFVAIYDVLGNKIWIYQSMLPGGEMVNDAAIDETNGYLDLVGTYADGEPFYMQWSLSGTWGAGPYRFYQNRGAVPMAIAVDGNGGIYIAGRLRAANGLNDDVFVYTPKWSYEFGSEGYDAGLGLALDNAGHLYVLGTIDKTYETVGEPGDQEVMAAKFSTAGVLKWLTQFGAGGNDAAVGAIVGQAGELLAAGMTTGGLLGSTFGQSDIFLTRMTSLQGPVLTVAPPVSPTRLASQVLTGKTSPGASVTIGVTLPTDSSAVLAPVAQYPDGSWECAVGNLVANADNVLTVTAADQSGSVTRTVTITVDIVPPSLTVSPVTSPTSESTQLINGTVEAGATLLVATELSPLPAAIATSNGAWSYAAALQVGENALSFTATDGVGNATIRSVNVVREAIPLANTIVITKAAYDARKKVLNIEATSNYQDAALHVDGYGPMTFSRLFKGKYYWTFSRGMTSSPATVTVSGAEGSRTATVL